MEEEKICKCGHKEEYHHAHMEGKIYRCNAITKLTWDGKHVKKKCKCREFRERK